MNALDYNNREKERVLVYHVKDRGEKREKANVFKMSLKHDWKKPRASYYSILIKLSNVALQFRTMITVCTVTGC